jgi:formylglycine-generating enzyme required for sulfatase activity
MRRLLVLAALLVALPAAAVEIEWVFVGDPGNPPDTAANAANCLNYAADCGSVPYVYYISKYEITNAQYAEFLNAVAASDPNALYNPAMGWDVVPAIGGITRSGSEGSFEYAVKPGFESKPVTYTSFYDAARFANWLQNGQPTGGQAAGTTETGAYDVALGANATREPGATVFLPSENEWYKAAYYDSALNVGLGGYYDYPAGTDTPTFCGDPGPTPNTANCARDRYCQDTPTTDVGAYSGSASPLGTFDQGGNVTEWNEEIHEFLVDGRGKRGGGSCSPGWYLGSELAPGDLVAPAAAEFGGFRVASLVPEPAQVLLVLTGGLVLAAVRRRRRA